MSRRTDRINGLLRQEISQLLSRELNDPRLSGLVTITQVDVTSDVRYAKVYVSVFGDGAQKEAALIGVISAKGFIRRELRGRLDLKFIPELKFILDETMEEADHIFRVLDTLAEDDPHSSTSNQEPPSDTKC